LYLYIWKHWVVDWVIGIYVDFYIQEKVSENLNLYIKFKQSPKNKIERQKEISEFKIRSFDKINFLENKVSFFIF